MRLASLRRAAPLLAVPTGALAGQGPPSLRGWIVSAETLAPLPYSTVALLPGFVARFTSDSGAFVFSPVHPGIYRLVARQIGYVPFDSTIAVTDSSPSIRIEVHRLAIELPPISVVARATCRAPGPPDTRTDPELALIFDQLRENAARYRLLADAYPFRYWNERVQSVAVTADSERVQRRDTLELASHGRWRYAPGKLIVTVQRSARGRERSMNIPTLADLADTAFHGSHCFSFGGLEPLGDAEMLRVDFQAAARLKTPDVDGWALLDHDSHQLRQLVLRLTRPNRAAPSLKALEVVVTFTELMPFVIVPGHIVATTTLHGWRGADDVRLLERQGLVGVRFLRSQPGHP